MKDNSITIKHKESVVNTSNQKRKTNVFHDDKSRLKAGFVVSIKSEKESEKFELLSWRSGLLGFLAMKYFKISKLFVGDTKNTYLSIFGEE